MPVAVEIKKKETKNVRTPCSFFGEASEWGAGEQKSKFCA